ncbi:dnaA protein [Poseidonocella pacifica]|uniref:DnaA protein n=1 Tax=Poseidonocella pacifica TaxID=871651 RepID=A0A1I0XIW2_9RHOB|nr:DnaA/Hda family protein [Poseidonocella pacifica]SFB00158.1 dnaA protein [Poseidonocella pacifica]
MAEQLRFDLEVRPALGREDFFISPANAVAVASVEGWRDWPGRKLLLIGPEGAGKTHLVHVWAAQTGARIVRAKDLEAERIDTLAAGPVAVEDVPDIAGQSAAEDALFHLHNLALAEGHALLLTANRPAQDWRLSLPDLASRMQATPAAMLAPPDDALLAAILMKLFGDRQINPAEGTIPFLLRRIERSFAAAAHIVEALDEAALAQQRPVGRALARDLLQDGGLDRDRPDG